MPRLSPYAKNDKPKNKKNKAKTKNPQEDDNDKPTFKGSRVVITNYKLIIKVPNTCNRFSNLVLKFSQSTLFFIVYLLVFN